MLSQFTNWFLTLVGEWFSSFWELVQDAAVAMFTALTGAVAALLAAIPVPAWLAGGLQAMFDALPPGLVYVAFKSGVAPALAILGGGYVFRLLRKLFTLFQW